MTRLRRADLNAPGWTRRRRGRGWSYADHRGEPITGPAALERIRALAIPPAWREVWICPWANGHIQAVGTDAAGRRQYLYHPQWRKRRDRLKHDKVLAVAQRLPAARRRVAADLRLDGMPREKVLALSFRLLDLALFRIGTERYERRDGSHGLATLLRTQVRVLPPVDGESEGRVRFQYPAKSGQVRDVVVEDEDVAALARALVRRKDDSPELLAWLDDGTWRRVSSADVVVYVKERLGDDASPKDFRTWHATVAAAHGLAAAGPAPRSARARRQVQSRVVTDVALQLGNTPSVCRASYIDPRVFDLWERGEAITPSRSSAVAERRTIALLS